MSVLRVPYHHRRAVEARIPATAVGPCRGSGAFATAPVPAQIEALIAATSAELLRRYHAEPIGEILLLLIQPLVQKIDLMAQLLIGAGRLREALGEAVGLIFQGLDTALELLVLVRQIGQLAVLVRFMLFLLIAGAEQLSLRWSSCGAEEQTQGQDDQCTLFIFSRPSKRGSGNSAPPCFYPSNLTRWRRPRDHRYAAPVSAPSNPHSRRCRSAVPCP